MLKQILAYFGVNVHLQIPDVTDVASLSNISTTSTYNVTHTPTYERLRGNLLH